MTAVRSRARLVVCWPMVAVYLGMVVFGALCAYGVTR